LPARKAYANKAHKHYQSESASNKMQYTKTSISLLAHANNEKK